MAERNVLSLHSTDKSMLIMRLAPRLAEEADERVVDLNIAAIRTIIKSILRWE